jgi:hypothetical protein
MVGSHHCIFLAASLVAVAGCSPPSSQVGADRPASGHRAAVKSSAAPQSPAPAPVSTAAPAIEADVSRVEESSGAELTPTYGDGSWSVAELRSRRELKDGDVVRLTAWVTALPTCPPCPKGARCKPCAPARAIVEDSPRPRASRGAPTDLAAAHAAAAAASEAQALVLLPDPSGGFGDSSSVPVPRLVVGERYVFECRFQSAQFTYVSHTRVGSR